MSKTFQTGNIDFSQIEPSINYAIDKIEEIYNTKEPLEELKKDLEEGTGRLSLTTITEFKLDDADLKQLEALLSKYTDALKENIKSRFDDVLSVLKAFNIFNPTCLPERTDTEFKDYGNTSIEALTEKFYPDAELHEKDEIVTEWNKIKYNLVEWKKDIIDMQDNASDLSKTQVCLKKLLRRKEDFRKFFPHIIHFAELCQSMPVSNAWPERGASAVKRIKSRLRSSLKEDMLMNLMTISVNGPKIGESKVIIEKAVQNWQEQKECRKVPKEKVSHNCQNSEVNRPKVSTLETECQTEITAETDICEILRQEVKTACKQMLLEGYRYDDGEESEESDSDNEDEF